jgi:hypothetical protein
MAAATRTKKGSEGPETDCPLLPPQILASGGGRCRDAGRVARRQGASLSHAADHESWCPESGAADAIHLRVNWTGPVFSGTLHKHAKSTC